MSVELIIGRVLDIDSLREGAIVCDDVGTSYREGTIFVTGPSQREMSFNFEQRDMGDNLFSSRLTLLVADEQPIFVESYDGKTKFYVYSDRTGKVYRGVRELLESRLSDLPNSRPNREKALRAVQLLNDQIGQPVSPNVISNNNRHFRTLV